MKDLSSRASGLLERVVGILDYRRLSGSAQRYIAAMGALFFIGGAVYSWSRLDVSVLDLDFGPLAILVVSAPLPFLLSAAEYRSLAIGLGRRVRWPDALDVALLGYAANLLPIPGGALVRISTLTDGATGSTLRTTKLTVVIGALWLTLAVLAAGMGLIALDGGAVGWAAVSVAVVLLGLLAIIAFRLKPKPKTLVFLATVMAIEIGFVAVATARTHFGFLGLDVGSTLQIAVVVAASSALSVAIGIVPSGLGLTEALAALLSGLTGIDPSAGFLVAALLRVVGLATAGTLTAARYFARRPSSPGRSKEGR